jgi:hypothetical protein
MFNAFGRIRVLTSVNSLDADINIGVTINAPIAGIKLRLEIFFTIER